MVAQMSNPGCPRPGCRACAAYSHRRHGEVARAQAFAFQDPAPLMPVRDVIHSSVVSTIFRARHSVSTYSEHIPMAVIAAVTLDMGGAWGDQR